MGGWRSCSYEGSDFPSPEEIRSHIGKDIAVEEVKRVYEFIEELGHGSGGTVDKVRYKNGAFERVFARKNCDNIEVERERFEREINLLLSLPKR